MTKQINVGGVLIGGGAPIVIQSMTNTDTRDAVKTAEQINALHAAGCQIARVAVPDTAAAKAISEIKRSVNIPIVADIHFDYRLALLSIENGCDKLRINPGNIGEAENVRRVANACGEKGIPIRVGVNSGSLEKEIEERFGGATAEALAESALLNADMLERFDFTDIIISVKSSDVMRTVSACRILSKKTPYPLHIGVTEAGTPYSGIIKSSVGIGALLLDGIGDTIRVSLTGDPIEEIRCAKEILKAAGVLKTGINVISCPTCGRTEIDLIGIAEEVGRLCENINKNITVAVMGCVVNGPGEAKHANLGIAGGKSGGVIFKDGQVSKKVPEADLLPELMKEIIAY
ncbi:4-hydroxy-3-methylbut-2-en-1-yl diphosphate synthase (flavodoxin) [Clostridia bacterium]|nr:4-hydroxy-3-methylbut-2-en-1-yl diphosphate synthase (flavodoxin) [Clostridia bacterium]